MQFILQTNIGFPQLKFAMFKYINLCCNADLQIDAIKFYVDSFLNRLINISIPRLFVIIFIICFGDQNDHEKAQAITC